MLENLFVNIAGFIRSWLEGIGIPALWTDVAMTVVHLVAILVFILVNALWLVYMERKVAGYMQARIGPNRVGPRGLLQTTCDIIKLISKEIILPKRAEKIPFLLAAAVIFVPPLAIFAVIPFGKGMVALDLDVGLFYAFALAGLSTIIIWVAGWSSYNKYSLIGGMRTVAQMVSYELPLVLAVLGVIMLSGSLNFTEIIMSQKNMWFIVSQPIAFVIFFVAALAECKRVPFDLVEGESEIIAGPYTEYSGMAFAMFFLSEYANIMIASALTVILFLGGWLAPFGWTFIPSWLWFFIKLYIIIFIIMWFRWTYPRIRIDQMLGFGWKVLVPLSLANIFVTGIIMYIYRSIGW